MLAAERCLHHPAREAVARCPECRHFYCRECITEHDDRVICATCLKKLVAAETLPAARRRNLWPAVQIGGGLLLAWFLFYCAGLQLVALPEEFHDDKIWQATFFRAMKGPTAPDE
jgi:hypothetical protein